MWTPSRHIALVLLSLSSFFLSFPTCPWLFILSVTLIPASSLDTCKICLQMCCSTYLPVRNLQVSVPGMVLWMKLFGFCYFFDPQHHASFSVLHVFIQCNTFSWSLDWSFQVTMWQLYKQSMILLGSKVLCITYDFMDIYFTFLHITLASMVQVGYNTQL